MKYIGFIVLLFLIACNSTKEQLSADIIPQPNNIDIAAGSLTLDKELTIGFYNSELQNTTKLFIEELNGLCALRVTEFNKADIKLQLIEGNKPDGSYVLKTTKKHVEISATTHKGVYYALQSLRQLILFSESKQNSYILPLVNIHDSPRFQWRGLMLDESRYFFGKEKVKQLLDVMAMHKLNVFHWHLTDVPGWRIEIKKYPRLSTIGGIGNDINPQAPSQFYTQDEIKEIVAYASERCIEVIPEIDMPGHARAANRAYPEFSGGGSKSHPEFTFNPGYEGTYVFLTDILREVCQLFPSKYIHLGGDEVHFGNESWNTNPHVLNLMKKEDLKDLREVESYFIHRMADTINALNKTVIGWDEIVDFGLEKENSMVMWWRHDKTKTLQNALENGYQTVLCPRIPLYFDFDQDKTHKKGRKWKGAFSPLEMIHAFPPDSLPGFLANTNLVKGLQANVWTERIQSEERLNYMIFPRLSALSEAGWTQAESKNTESFKERLKPMLEYFEHRDIEFYNPFTPDKTPEPHGDFRKKLKQKRAL